MKKYLVVLLLAMITTGANAGWHTYPDDGCSIEVWFLGRDHYHFCGAHETRCNGDWAETGELQNTTHWYNNGQSATLDKTRYWCCGGQVTTSTKNLKKKDRVGGTPGKWVAGTDWIVKSEPKTITVAGGTCTYVETTDICGNVSGKEKCEGTSLTKDTVTCPSGQYYRAGSCATLCQSGYAYESTTSNRCVECPETSTQGIVSDEGSTGNEVPSPEHRVCRKCNASTSLFDPKTKQCIAKTDVQVTALSMNDLVYGKNGRTKKIQPQSVGSANTHSVSNECWTKFGAEYKKCVLNK